MFGFLARSSRKKDLRRISNITFLGDFETEGAPPVFGGDGSFEIGDGVKFIDAPSLYAEKGARIVIGAKALLNKRASIYACREVEIGPDCLIADQVSIFDSNFHQVDEDGAVRQAPVKIGRNVWVGFRSILLPGVEIGDHSVIGAGSVVTRSIPGGVLAAGSPARVIRDIRVSDDFRRV